MNQDAVATPDEIARLKRDGMFVRHGYFSSGELDAIESAADRAVAHYNEHPRDVVDMYNMASRKDGIIFVNQFMDESDSAPELLRFSLQPKIAGFAKSVAGPRAAHHCYQVVYKFPRFQNPFPWHQDHIHTPSDRPFYNMWIALSDMTEANGCLRVMPGEALDTVLNYHQTPFGMSCWPLDDPNQGVPMVMERGSIFVITSYTLHGSGGNSTNGFRKALLVVFIDGDATVYGKAVRRTPYS
jgi:hypothetical protein